MLKPGDEAKSELKIQKPLKISFQKSLTIAPKTGSNRLVNLIMYFQTKTYMNKGQLIEAVKKRARHFQSRRSAVNAVFTSITKRLKKSLFKSSVSEPFRL